MKQTKKEKYHQYLKSPAWWLKRLEVIYKKGNNCEKCGSDKNIQIHHGTYIRLYKEELKDLFVLCNDCHFKLHEKYGTTNLLKATKAFIKGEEFKSKNKSKKLKNIERIKNNIAIYGSFYHIRGKTRVKFDQIMSIRRERNRIIKKERKNKCLRIQESEPDSIQYRNLKINLQLHKIYIYCTYLN